jgi:hypothetical protein
MTRYGILDDFNEVVRWVWERPVGRAYITVKVPRARKPRIDLAALPDALL